MNLPQASSPETRIDPFGDHAADSGGKVGTFDTRTLRVAASQMLSFHAPMGSPVAIARDLPSGEYLTVLTGSGVPTPSGTVIVAPEGAPLAGGGIGQKLTTPSTPPAARVRPSGENDIP